MAELSNPPITACRCTAARTALSSWEQRWRKARSVCAGGGAVHEQQQHQAEAAGCGCTSDGNSDVGSTRPEAQRGPRTCTPTVAMRTMPAVFALLFSQALKLCKGKGHTDAHSASQRTRVTHGPRGTVKEPCWYLGWMGSINHVLPRRGVEEEAAQRDLHDQQEEVNEQVLHAGRGTGSPTPTQR